jgi:hypothetical protein
MLNLDLLYISESDIDEFKELSSSPLQVSGLAHHDTFSKVENLFKFITIFGFARKFEEIAAIVDFFDWNRDINENGSLEVALGYLYQNKSFEYESMPRDVQTCIQFYLQVNTATTTHDINWRKIDLLCRMRLLQYLMLSQQFEKAQIIIALMELKEKICIVRYFGSLLRFQSEYLKRVRPNADYKPWLKIGTFLEQAITNIPLNEFDELRYGISYIYSKIGALDEAVKITKSVGTNKRLEHFFLMQKALNGKDMKRATFFADKLILTSKVKPTGKIKFDRDAAETALIRVNEIFRQAGLEVFIISGTLLGCIRDGRIFEHDKDFDLGVIGWEAQFDIASVLLKSKEFSVNPRNLRGHNLYLMPVVHNETGFDFDIFFFHDKGEYFLHGIQSRLGYTFHYKFSKFGLTDHKFLGSDFLIPDNYSKMLTENYGHDWREPNKNYFVNIQAPALQKKSGDTFAFAIRHEMLQCMEHGAPIEKANTLIKVLESVKRDKDKPSDKVVNHFLNEFKKQN